MTIFFTFALIVGLQLYAKYETCDPTKAKIIDKPDQVSEVLIYFFIITNNADLLISFQFVIVFG